MKVARQQRERDASLFRHESKRFVGVDAAGDRQIEKTGDERWDCLGGNDRCREDRGQG